MARGVGLDVNSKAGAQIDGSGEGVRVLMLVLFFCGALDGSIGGIKYDGIVF